MGLVYSLPLMFSELERHSNLCVLVSATEHTTQILSKVTGEKSSKGF